MEMYPLDSEYDEPLAITLHKLTVQMHEPQKRLWIYKQSSQRLVILCESYALRCIKQTKEQPDSAQHSSTVDQENAESMEKAMRWYSDIGKFLSQWSSLGAVDALSKWGEIKQGLKHIYSSCPVGIRKLKATTSPDGLSTLFVEPKVEQTIDTVRGAFSSNEDITAIMRLDHENALPLIELLDIVLDKLDAEDPLRSRIIYILRKLCVLHAVLPKSCRFPTAKEHKLKEQGLEEHPVELQQDHPQASGGFADVWLGHFEGRAVALKAFRIYGRDNLEAVKKTFRREAIVWRHLHHPNVAEFIGVSENPFPLSMVCEWMANGNLTQYLKMHTESNRLELLVDIAQGLAYLHSQGVVHGDLKGANVLINDKLHACLTDFGLTAVTYDPHTVNAISTSSSVMGSVRWMSPELLNPEQAGLQKSRPIPQSDVYSLAMVMWETFTGHIPFYECSRDATVVFRVILGIRPERPAEAGSLGLTDAVWDLMVSCWTGEWRSRPQISNVLGALREACEQYRFIAVRPARWPLFADTTRSAATLTSDVAGGAMSQEFTVSQPLASNNDYQAIFGTSSSQISDAIDSDAARELAQAVEPLFPGIITEPGAASSSSTPWESVVDVDAWF